MDDAFKFEKPILLKSSIPVFCGIVKKLTDEVPARSGSPAQIIERSNIIKVNIFINGYLNNRSMENIIYTMNL